MSAAPSHETPAQGREDAFARTVERPVRGSPQRGAQAPRAWTPREDGYLRALWKSWSSLETIARFLGRTRSTTLWRARALRLGPGPGVSLRTAARVLGVSRARLVTAAREAGIRIRRAPDRGAQAVEPRRRRRALTLGQLDRLAQVIAPELAPMQRRRIISRRVQASSDEWRRAA